MAQPYFAKSLAKQQKCYFAINVAHRIWKKSVDIHETIKIREVMINESFFMNNLPLDDILNECEKFSQKVNSSLSVIYDTQPADVKVWWAMFLPNIIITLEKNPN